MIQFDIMALLDQFGIEHTLFQPWTEQENGEWRNEIMVNFKFFLIIYAFYNAYVFLVVWRDKRRAKANQWRIPEFNLLFMGFLLGGVGLYAGMLFFKHKTSNLKFSIGAPLLVLWNFLAIGFLYYIGRFN